MRSLLRWSSAALILSTFSGQAAPAQQRSQFQLFDKKSSKGAEIAPMASDAKVNRLAPSPSLRLFAEIGQAKLPSSFRQQQPFPELMNLGAKIPASTWPNMRVWEGADALGTSLRQGCIASGRADRQAQRLEPQWSRRPAVSRYAGEARDEIALGFPEASARQNFHGGSFKP